MTRYVIYSIHLYNDVRGYSPDQGINIYADWNTNLVMGIKVSGPITSTYFIRILMASLINCYEMKLRFLTLDT